MFRHSFPKLYKEGKLSQLHQSRLSKTICIHLNYPENLVGLEGRLKHGFAWDIWLDGFIGRVLDAAKIGGREAFWNAGDKITMLKYIKSLVRYNASSIRNYLKRGTLPAWMGVHQEQATIMTDAEPREPDLGSESSTDDSETEDLSGSEVQGENPRGQLLPHTTTKLQASGRPIMPVKKRRKTNPIAPVGEGAPATLSRSVTFLTRMQIPHTDIVRHEFVDTVGIVTLADFTDMLRTSNGILPEQHIMGFEVEIGGRTVDIDVEDPESEWEWGLVLGILHFSGVPDGQKAYVDIRMDG